jgi:hypothetical protein
MRRATMADVDLIKSVLLLSFKNDPHLTWLLEESKNKFKLTILIDYVVHQTLRRGEIYLTDDNKAVALWDCEQNEKMSFHYIWRNIAFLIQIPAHSTAEFRVKHMMIANVKGPFPMSRACRSGTNVTQRTIAWRPRLKLLPFTRVINNAMSPKERRLLSCGKVRDPALQVDAHQQRGRGRIVDGRRPYYPWRYPQGPLCG